MPVVIGVWSMAVPIVASTWTRSSPRTCPRYCPIVNIFVANDALYWITTYAGVAIFAGLTAYDMQKIKQWGARDAGDGRMAVLGALALYLDFINMFLFLLRIFGGRR